MPVRSALRLRPRPRPRPRLRLLAALAVIAAVTTAACTPAGLPSTIDPLNRPTPVAGYTNDALPASVLYTVNSACRTDRPAAGSLVTMIRAAAAGGVTLSPVQCYRDYAGQLYWRNWWCARGLCANAAVPGYSNHGWAKAVDFAATTWTSPDYRWLVAHAGTYGWNHPGGVDEAWHWEWVGDGGTQHGATIRPDLTGW